MKGSKIEDVVEVAGNVLTYREESGSYSMQAETPCGHGVIHLMAEKSDGSFGVEHHGIKVHCSACGLIQSFGAAKPGVKAKSGSDQ